ncbi:NifB/NifX family molybdenum-iron cluster-binding protein [Fusibacter sp. JL216-2]|uniref:NifB/NifX family molybdenum-iron cluster-binding protein n=1 Tax=Fusibacter sp. JL216-2 TaxID=3071453 RepID=UPI003D3367B5
MKKIAIAKDGDRVSSHFGHCSGFQVYHVLDNQVKAEQFIESPGHKPGFLPKFLAEKEIDTIISGGMGATAQNLFNENGISVVVGANGMLADVIKAYIAGEIQSTGSVCEAHSHSDSCGGH